MAGFESTGPYAEAPFHLLMKERVILVQTSPMYTKRPKELMGSSPNETDKKDQRIITIIALGYTLTLVVPEGKVPEQQSLRQVTKNTQVRLVWPEEILKIRLGARMLSLNSVPALKECFGIGI